MNTFNFIIIFICILTFMIGYFVVSQLIKFIQKKRSNRKTHENGRNKSERHFNEYDKETPCVKPWYETLGVPANASVDQIRYAYLQLIKQYHPDRLSNLAPELKNIAEKRTKEINQAYHEGLKKNH